MPWALTLIWHIAGGCRGKAVPPGVPFGCEQVNFTNSNAYKVKTPPNCSSYSSSFTSPDGMHSCGSSRCDKTCRRSEGDCFVTLAAFFFVSRCVSMSYCFPPLLSRRIVRCSRRSSSGLRLRAVMTRLTSAATSFCAYSSRASQGSARQPAPSRTRSQKSCVFAKRF